MSIPSRRMFLGLTSAGLAGLVTTPFLRPTAAVAAPPSPVWESAGPHSLDGRTPVDVSSAVPSLRGLSQGTLSLRFRATRSADAQALFSLSDPSAASSNVTLSLNKGNLHVEARDAGAYASTLTWPVTSDRPGEFDDSRWHTVTWIVGEEGTALFVDGTPVHWGTSTAFLSHLGTSATSALIGGNRDSSGQEWTFVGEIADITVHDVPLSAAEIASLAPAPDTAEKWVPMRQHSPTTPLVNRFGELDDLGAVEEGTLHARFVTTASGLNTILSAGSTQAPSTNLTVAVQDGALVVEARSDGASSMIFTVPGHWNDGVAHTVTLTVSSTRGTVLFADGSQVERHSSTMFFSQLQGMDGLWTGGNVDNGGEQWKFTGEIGDVMVFRHALHEPEVQRLSPAQEIRTQALFDRGYADSANYRIPTLAATPSGTLLAAADQRRTNPYDSPNDINLSIRRSTDDGQTWDPVQVVIDYPGSGADGASAIDSVLIADTVRDQTVCVVDRFSGGVGQANSAVGTGFTEDGLQVLTDAEDDEFHLHLDGHVTTADGESTGYTVAANGDVTLDGTAAGNIHLKKGVDPAESLLEIRTSYLVMTRSADDGGTWEQPVDLTHQVKAPWMRFLGTGPGSGVQLRHGAATGRLLVPVYFNNDVAPANVYSSAVVYSDDGGQTWQRSASPNDGRVVDGVTYDSETLTSTALATHEPTIAELPDGSVVMFMRNLAPGGLVLRSVSTDAGETWSSPEQVTGVPDIFSQPNTISWDAQGDSTPRLLFGNASRRFPGQDGRTARGTGVIRLSEDGGLTWDRNRVFRADTYVYNSMVQLPNGNIGLLWELEWDGIYYSEIPWTWLNGYGM